MSETSDLLKQVNDPYVDMQVYGPIPADAPFMGVLTLYSGQNAVFSLTLSGADFGAVTGRLQVMLIEVLGSELKGQRCLPRSGDEVIRYW